MVSVLWQPEPSAKAVVDGVLLPPRRSTGHGRWRWWLGGLVLSMYLLTASGHVQTIDAQQEMQVAARLVHGRDLTVQGIEFRGGGTQRGRDGGQYSAHDIGMSLVYAPLALLPGAVGPSGEPAELMDFSAGLVNAVLGAAAVLVMADLLARLGIDRRAATLGTLGFAFATMQWVYAHIAFDVTANALGILVALWCVIRARTAPPARWLLAGGIALGVAVTIRSDTLLLVPLISIPALAQLRPVWRQWSKVLSRGLAWVLPIAAGAMLNAWYNWFRFGSVFNNGHVHDPLLRTTTPLSVGLAGQLVSPGKGMLFFSPFMLVALAGWPAFFRRERLLATALLMTIVTNLVAHARLADWSGAEAWGSRHTMQILALVMLPAAYLLDDLGSPHCAESRPRQRHRVAASGVVLVALAGVLVQLTAVGVDYLSADRLWSSTHPVHNGAEWAAVNWRAKDSQIWLGAQSLGRSIDGRAPYPDDRHGGIVRPPVPHFDLWWIREFTANRYVAAAAVALPFLVIAAIAAAIGLSRALHTQDHRPPSISAHRATE